MSEFVVRPVRPEELAVVGALTVAAYREDGLLVADPDYVHELSDAAGRVAHSELLVAVDGGGQVLGSVTLTPPGSPMAEISRPGELEFRMLATAPAARSRGVGEALTRAVVDRARELGAECVVMSSLEAMTAAHRLYTRLGFTRLPERDWEPVPGFWLRAFALPLT
ncbi:GNAT family N-acetyltransferase [Amycolatopsis rhizosphaerae]|uniref:GNAT family N-acetyltransferase n=1 Tax=Amycolatopsis rhizosphaerae TaxID=2053003 RepID=A0A558CLL0_9PSEU|nr:GNAT family N-acetyltransferase [Amycolatopsis rhizosphaerae]TVT49653.1 GNAT family N-acetyltransferase [Amycolatopsis rhizosphaerae]